MLEGGLSRGKGELPFPRHYPTWYIDRTKSWYRPLCVGGIASAVYPRWCSVCSNLAHAFCIFFRSTIGRLIPDAIGQLIALALFLIQLELLLFRIPSLNAAKKGLWTDILVPRITGSLLIRNCNLGQRDRFYISCAFSFLPSFVWFTYFPCFFFHRLRKTKPRSLLEISLAITIVAPGWLAHPSRKTGDWKYGKEDR